MYLFILEKNEIFYYLIFFYMENKNNIYNNYIWRIFFDII